MKESEDIDMDSTQALLDSTLPETPVLVDSYLQDSDEDEIFFGNRSTKESKAPFSKSSRRDTICMTEMDKGRRRSYNIGGRKGRETASQQDTSRGCSSKSSSLYSQENSITEEEEEDDNVFRESSVVQVAEISSTIIDVGGELEIEVGDQNNITGRSRRKKMLRQDLKSVVSLPSATKMRETMDIEMDEGEIERSTNLNEEEMETKSPEAAEGKVTTTRDSNEGNHGGMSVSSDDSASSEYSSTSTKEEVESIEVEKRDEKCPMLDHTDFSIVADRSTFISCNETNSTVEVSGIEPLTDVSYANSTGNSGIVTFKTQTSGSGVYDSFSDDTRDEFLQDTEVQEETLDKNHNNHSCNEEYNDDKFANVKRRIFEDESGMDNSIEAPEEETVDDAPFTLGRVSSVGTSFESGQFVLGSIDSDLPGDETNESNIGDDSVFSKSSQGGNSCLSYGYEVMAAAEPEVMTEEEAEVEDMVEGEAEAEIMTEDEAVASEDQVAEDEEIVDDSPKSVHSNGGGRVPNILVTSPIQGTVQNDEERCSSPEIIPASPRLSTASSYHTAPTSSNVTDLSPMFDTTAEEMMLFEMYGETYDEQVEAMSKEERVDLKKKLQSRGDEEINMVAEKLHKIMQEKSRELSIGSTVTPFSLPASSPSFQFPPGEELEEDDTNTPVSIYNSQPEFRVPPMHTYNLPTTSSLGRMVTKTPSPSKITTPWLPPSPAPNLPPVLSPAKAALKPSRSLSKLPVPVQTTPRQLQGSPLKVFSVTPGSNKKASRVCDFKAAAYAVASPVAEYVRNNPAPPLVQNVKGTSAQRDLESTLVEMEDKENMRRLSQLPPCPLPAAVYETGTIAEEIIEYETGPEYNYIPEAYGTVNSSAKVTKHVARVKVGSGQQGLKWNESCLVNDVSLNSTPSVARHKAPFRSVLKQTRRDSGLFDESMLEMSVHETKVVKKIARGKGRGRGKK